MRTEILKETTLFVTDLEAAESFYTNIAGLEVAERVENHHSLLNFDDGSLMLFQTPTTFLEDEGTPSEPKNVGQISFGINPADISSWRKRLQKFNVSIEEEIAWPNGAPSIIFHDPTGNRIELKTQKQRSPEMSKAAQRLKEIPGGLNAKWKLYHAFKLGGQRDSTSGN